MKILIIIVGLIAIAIIFGRRVAQLIVLGIGALLVIGVVLVAGILLIPFLWDQIATSEITQGVLGVVLFTYFIYFIRMAGETKWLSDKVTNPVWTINKWIFDYHLVILALIVAATIIFLAIYSTGWLEK